MKKIAVVSALVAAVFSALAQDAASPTNAAAKTGMRYKTGGTIMRPVPEGAKAVVFLDALDDEKGAGVLADYAKRFEYMTSLLVKRAKGGAADYDNKAGDVVIALVSKGDLAVMPAKRMAVVPLSADDGETAKALWKATVAVFSLMGEPPNDFSGTALVRAAAESAGIPQVQKVFYKKALEEGWAPAPSDEFQKAAYEKFQAEKAAKAAAGK